MLSDLQRQEWNENGVLGTFSCGLRENEMATRREFLYQKYLEPSSYDYNHLINLHLKSKVIYSLAKSEAILQVIRDLVGPDVLLWRSSLFVKMPHKLEHEVKWHQDDYGWKMNPMESVTAWLALDDVSEANGPIEFFAGSHLSRVKHVNESGSYFSFKAEPESFNENSKSVKMTCKAGDFIVFHSKILHRSAVNTSEKPRLAVAFRYCDPRIKIESPESAGLLMSGVDSYKQNRTYDAPDSN